MLVKACDLYTFNIYFHSELDILPVITTANEVDDDVK